MFTDSRTMSALRSKFSSIDFICLQLLIRFTRHCINHQDAENIFLTLLKLYLQPRDPKAEPLFAPALELIARQSRHLAASAVMDLLPPLFSVSDVERYFVGATKRQAAAKVSTLFQREVYRARLDQLQRASVLVEEQHVKVTDATLCPGCHKRIGNSVIAVHQPHGEVTHYRCSLSPTRKT